MSTDRLQTPWDTPDLAPERRKVKVWDPLVRLIHWVVAAGVFLNLTLLRESDDIHEIVGYVVLGAVSVRVLWGLVAPGHARFSTFIPTPKQVLGYLGSMKEGHEPRYIGHNPAGSVMMLALIGLLLVIGLTGWMMSLDQFWGVRWVEEVHEATANLIIAAIAVHVLAAIFVSFKHHENLPLAMITGRKRPAAQGDIDNAPPAG